MDPFDSPEKIVCGWSAGQSTLIESVSINETCPHGRDENTRPATEQLAELLEADGKKCDG